MTRKPWPISVLALFQKLSPMREETGIFSDLNYWWEQRRAKEQKSPSVVEKLSQSTPESESENRVA